MLEKSSRYDYNKNFLANPEKLLFFWEYFEFKFWFYRVTREQHKQ